MDLEAQLLGYVLQRKTHGRAMRAVVTALLEGGARSRNLIEGICEHNGDPRGAALDKLLLLEIVVMHGDKRGAVYDLTVRARRAARALKLDRAA